MVMTFVNGELQARFMTRVRGLKNDTRDCGAMVELLICGRARRLPFAKRSTRARMSSR
jgi:hypothetical protein